MRGRLQQWPGGSRFQQIVRGHVGGGNLALGLRGRVGYPPAGGEPDVVGGLESPSRARAIGAMSCASFNSSPSPRATAVSAKPSPPAATALASQGPLRTGGWGRSGDSAPPALAWPVAHGCRGAGRRRSRPPSWPLAFPVGRRQREGLRLEGPHQLPQRRRIERIGCVGLDDPQVVVELVRPFAGLRQGPIDIDSVEHLGRLAPVPDGELDGVQPRPKVDMFGIH